jgi:hypothetical protein
MAVAFTGYTVGNHVENGGDGLKLGFFCVQLARVRREAGQEKLTG